MSTTAAGIDEVVMPAPVQHSDHSPIPMKESLKDARQTQMNRRRDEGNNAGDWANLDEVEDPAPVQNPNEQHLYQHKFLEDEERDFGRQSGQEPRSDTDQTIGYRPKKEKSNTSNHEHLKNSRLTELYTISYLIFFALLGTLARLGLQAITFYPGAPVIFSELWANFGGSTIMGFLSEDRNLFQQEWGSKRGSHAQRKFNDEENMEKEPSEEDMKAAKKAHLSTKKTIPLYIGLAISFCGSLTSFSSFIRDVYLALSNDLPSPLNHPTDYQLSTTTTSTVHRNGGYSFMALLAVIIITTSLSLSALFIGAHLALLLDRFTPTFPFRFTRSIIDPLTVFLAFGCWLGAVFLAIFPPDRHSGDTEIWRGRVVFALVFAPLGCLLRFYASKILNGKIASFPLGTFAVNVFATAVLGMSYDLQHVPLGGVVGCQVLQGIEDGFCGCLSTVSTWASELDTLKRRHAYRYGAASVLVSLGLLVIIMGSMQWTRGFDALACVK